MRGLIQRNRLRLERDLQGSSLLWKFSPAAYGLYTDLIPVLQSRVKGRVLDVGCGTMPFKSFLEGRFEAYDGLDIERRSLETKFTCDAQDMAVVADSEYDTVLSLSSLEHIPNPWKAFSEMARVAAPGGHIVVLVPHLSRYHEEPLDFHRFTRYGLDAIGISQRLEVIEIRPIGGLFAFLGHQLSTVILGVVWGIPVLCWIFFWLNYACIVRPAIFFDGILRTQSLFPLDILAVYRKPGEAACPELPV